MRYTLGCIQTIPDTFGQTHPKHTGRRGPTGRSTLRRQGGFAMKDQQFASIDAFVEQHRDDILRDITRLVAVPSVQGDPAPGAPFGPGPRAALDTALAI